MRTFLLLFQVSMITTLLSDQIQKKRDRRIINTLPGYPTCYDLLFPFFNKASAISSAIDPGNNIINTYPEHFMLQQTLLFKQFRPEQLRDT